MVIDVIDMAFDTAIYKIIDMAINKAVYMAVYKLRAPSHVPLARPVLLFKSLSILTRMRALTGSEPITTYTQGWFTTLTGFALNDDLSLKWRFGCQM